MDINYYKKYEPIDGKWYITEELGSGAFGKVFAIERKDFSMAKSALKIITIPSSQNEVKSYREENYDLDEQSISSYFHGFVEEFTKEFELMLQLKGKSNIVSIEDFDVKKHTEGVGWDLFIRMELLTPMNKYFAENSPKTRDVIKLGIDICKALEVCQKYNIVHRDIKPSNIFVSPDGEFKLGDFGVARTLEKTSSGLSKKGTYTYMAPEVYRGDAYGSNVDIYSLGIVMYKLLNNNREPFKVGRTHEDEENALIARMKNEPMPKPENADGRLAEIILKACSYEPKDRYESPLQMREELENILYSENEEKLVFPEGDQLEYEPSNVPEKVEPQTSGVFDEEPETIPEGDFEDGPTRGIFDEIPVGKGDKDSTEISEENTTESDRELSWKGILAICGVILIVIVAAIWGATSNSGSNVDNSNDDAWLEAYYVGNNPMRILETDYSVEEYAISVAKENTELLDNINNALVEIENEGIKKAIIDKYILGIEHNFAFQQDVEGKPELSLAVNGYFAPYEYYDAENSILGIDIEIAQAVADRLGMKLVIVEMDFDSILASVQSGQTDIGMGGMTVTEHRMNAVDFSNPYVTNTQSVLVPEGSSILNVDELYSGYKIGVQSDTTGSAYAESDFGSDSIEYYPTSQEAVGAMIRGEIDCVILDKSVAEAFIAANSNSIDSGYSYDTLKIGYTEFEPIAFYNEGELVGFDIELAKYVCEQLGIAPEFTLISWDQKEELLNNGEIDCIWNAMTLTDERKIDNECTSPYISVINDDSSVDEWAVAFRKGETDIMSIVNHMLIVAKEDGVIDELADKYGITYIKD